MLSKYIWEAFWRKHGSLSGDGKAVFWILALGALAGFPGVYGIPLTLLASVVAIDIGRGVLLGLGRTLGFARSAARTARAAGEDRRRQREWDASAPERERTERADDEARRRREDARAGCELLYAAHAADIADRLPRAAFDQLLSRFLTDDLPAEDVERKAGELQLLIRQHAERVRPAEKREAIAQVQAWYDEQLRQLRAMPDGPLRESFEALLLKSFNDRMLRAMEVDL